jgi:hypothetical protein
MDASRLALDQVLGPGLSRRLNDSSVFGKDLVGYAVSHFPDFKHVLLYSISGDLELAGYSSVGFIKIVEIDDSAYICHRFHPNAHLSNTWRGKAFLLRVDQKRIGVPLNRRVKIELAKT